jgi:APA family basic amino acid/polyamine antiporter
MGVAWFAVLIKVGAVAGLTSVMLILTYGQTRVFYAMARDGLLPKVFAILHEKFRTPWVGTLILGCVIAVLAAILPIQILGDLVSLGTATAFGIVCLSIMFLRTTRPELPRPFRVPLGGGLVSLPFMVGIAFLSLLAMLAFFRWFLLSTWTNVGIFVVVAICGLWLLAVWKKRANKVWMGTAPVLGIIGAMIMVGPLIEDVFRKLIAGDPIPAFLLGGYALLGALIYIFYGLRNSRLAKGEDISEDYAGLSPMQAELHGVGDDKA